VTLPPTSLRTVPFLSPVNPSSQSIFQTSANDPIFAPRGRFASGYAAIESISLRFIIGLAFLSVAYAGGEDAGERHDLALLMPISSSSGNARFANDRDINSYWQSTGVPAVITVDLGKVFSLQQIVLSEKPSMKTPGSITVEVLTSSDGEKYLSSITSRSYPICGDQPAIIHLGDANARFVRLNITGSSPNKLIEIAQFQVFGVDLKGSGVESRSKLPAEQTSVGFGACRPRPRKPSTRAA
jgi:hypothetical protein